MAVDYDNPWKEALERFFELVVAFFFPKLHTEIDWSLGHESLDTARKLLREAAVGKRVADALVKVYARGEGEGRDVRNVHAEVQRQFETDFANRLDDYNCSFKLKLGHPVITAAILGDDNPEWRPAEYVFECGGFRKRVGFLVVKLLDYRGREEELEKGANPVGLLVVAHLLTLETKREDEARADGKLRLLKVVLDRKMESEQTHQFVRLIDWIVDLPAARQREVSERLRQHAREDQMPFLSYFEQVGYDRGLDEGERKGEQKGMLRGGIQTALELKFGEQGLALLPAIQALQDLAVLQTLLDASMRTSSLDEVRLLLPPS